MIDAGEKTDLVSLIAIIANNDISIISIISIHIFRIVSSLA